MPTLTFELSEEAFNEFEELRSDLKLERGELFQVSVRYLQWTWHQFRQGENIYIGKIQTTSVSTLNEVKLPYFPDRNEE